MKAVVYDKKNQPDCLTLREVEKPALRDGEVLIKVHAVSINAADYRSMQIGSIPKSGILGADVAGRVEAVGANARKFQVGDEVLGDISDDFGGFAEYAAAPEKLLARKPAGLSFEDAAALPMASLTALQGLRLGNIQPGKNALICGAGGGVGTYAVQLAKHFGAVVTAVCGPHNVEMVRSLGADEVIDYTREDFTRSGRQYDLILAVNGHHTPGDYRRALLPGGVMVMAGGSYRQVFTILLLSRILSIGSKKFRFLAARSDPQDLETILQLVEEGKVHPVIDRRYPLEQTAEAVRYIRQGHARGKVVIRVAGEI